MAFCTKCGQSVVQQNRFCGHCGASVWGLTGPSVSDTLTASRRVVPDAIRTPQQVIYVQNGIKSSGLAAVLSFFWCGLGQIYTGRIGTGIAMMLGYPVFLFFGCALTFGGCLSAAGASTNDEKSAAGGVLLFGLVFLLGALALWIFGIVDAYRTAEQTSHIERI